MDAVDPRNPLLIPSPVMQGQSASFLGKGTHLENLEFVPTLRGTIRASFVMPTAGSIKPIVLVTAALAAGPTFGIQTTAGGAVAGLYGTAFVLTSGVILPGSQVTATLSWDSVNPINGPYYAKLVIEKVVSPVTVTSGGVTPFAALPAATVMVGEVGYSGGYGATETDISRVQMGRIPL